MYIVDVLAKEKTALDKENEIVRKNLEEHIKLEREQKEERDQVYTRQSV